MTNDFLVTPEVASQLLGVSRGTLIRYVKEGKVSSRRTPGGHHRYLVSSLAQAAHTADETKFFEYAKELKEGYKCKV